MENKIIGLSVVMPSYLRDYEGSRTNSSDKFIRAVKSFQEQFLSKKELIIVSDGCEKTNEIYDSLFKDDPSIKLIRCEKVKARWPGILREVGRAYASYDWICYLDSDDLIAENHLNVISSEISSLKDEVVLLTTKCYHPLPDKPTQAFLDFMNMEKDQYLEWYNKIPIIKLNGVEYKITGRNWQTHTGTWQIVHHRRARPRWENSEKVGEDFKFIEHLKTVEKWKEASIGYYVIMHMANNIDF